ncbi:hypothetical protein [Paenibacillus sp. y28]|uniref:hypothetical protein n=1 Tax=Paenibacillus sp. y28 TaxID=3129110 RepID=UPI003019BF84
MAAIGGATQWQAVQQLAGVTEPGEAVQLPDLLFHQYCSEVFRINRGIYNTIDEWLYRSGYVTIIKRREAALSFLDYVNRQPQEGPGQSLRSIRFGQGGLTRLLQEYFAAH